MTLQQFLTAVKVSIRDGRVLVGVSMSSWIIIITPPPSIPVFSLPLHFFFLLLHQSEHHLTPTMVVYGVKMIYVPMMPGHKKRLPKRLGREGRERERERD